MSHHEIKRVYASSFDIYRHGGGLTLIVTSPDGSSMSKLTDGESAVVYLRRWLSGAEAWEVFSVDLAHGELQ